ncbi:MAG: glycosyltransferase family 9 protein [Candidatus Desulfofervidus auxilii]|nr:glycosyltransferase family 9 protein [Candidatus Desulfofervidus auxilii]
MNVVLSTLIKSKCVISGIDPRRPLAMKMKKFVDIPIVLNPYKTYHISEWPKLCLEKIGVKIKEKDIKEAYKKYDFPEIQYQIYYWKKQGFKVCSLVISAGSEVRLWSHNKFSRLIEELYKKNIISILIGTKDDVRLKKKIKISVPIIDFVGKTDFRNLESILRNSDFVISLDTSIMHLASLLGKKVIALFGAGNINLAKPVFSEAYIIKKELGCSGCGDICIFKRQKRYPCMEMITVNDVLINLTKVL